MRRISMAACLWMAACGGAGVRPPELPASVAPDWTRGAVETVSAGQFPELLRSAGVKQGWRTEYREADGTSAVVDVYGLRSSAQGLDLVQKWHPRPENAQFYTEHYLLNIAWTQGAKRDALAALVRSLPKLVEAPARRP
jgi:hypothetical protein